MSTPPKIPLIVGPTPCHRLPRFSEELGLDLWIKRDDLTGFALGGNKGRKLEYLMPQILASGARVVVTNGAIQSNFLRHLAVACAMYGIHVAAVVMALPHEPGRKPEGDPPVRGGNRTLCDMVGIDLRLMEDGTWDELEDAAKELAAEYRQAGHKVFEIPVGGSSGVSAFAFFKAAEEISAAPPFDFVLVATGSGSTQTGLAYALKPVKTKVIGICSDPEPELVDHMARLSAELEAIVGLNRRQSAEEFYLDTEFAAPGYGMPSQTGMAAMRWMARKEGIFLDPIYTAKAFDALLEYAAKGILKGRVLFWHTGGGPGIFASSNALNPGAALD